MTFEVFQRPSASRVGLLVTVQPNGVLRLNAAAQRAINQPTHVHLLVDLAAGKVGIKAAPVAGPAAYLVSRSGMVSAAEFVRYTRIVPGRHPAEFDGDMLVADCG